MSHKILRRFHGYDYARGGSMFVTATLAERRPLFGRVVRERVELSEAGEIVKRDLLEAANHFYGFITREIHDTIRAASDLVREMPVATNDSLVFCLI